MEVDTEAALSLVSEATYRENGQTRLWNRAVRNCTRTQERPYLSMIVCVTYKSQVDTLPLLVEGPSMLGRIG